MPSTPVSGPGAAAFIQTTYEQLAQLGDSGLCCSPIELYSPDELASLPEEILRLSSGCGHPVEDAPITEGMTILDIGSGAGTDAILAARRTGPTGRVIGVDPSDSMRERAARSAADLDLTWVEFRAGTAENLPVADATADLVISNCVLSLSTDPTGAWTQIARALRPAGQITVSDVVGGATRETLDAKTRCETGIEWPEYTRMLARLGFTGIRPVRVRAARYRDGATARSVTLHAWHGRAEPQLAVDVIDDQSAGAAHQLAARLSHTYGDRVSVRVLDAAGSEDRDIVALLLDEAAPQPAVSVCIDGLAAPVGAHDASDYVRDLLE